MWGQFTDLSLKIDLAQIASIWLEGYILGTLLNYMVEKDPVAEAHKAQVGLSSLGELRGNGSFAANFGVMTMAWLS